MRILLTGATGLLGHRLCRHLTSQGDEVVALSRRPSHAGARSVPERGALLWMQGNPTVRGPWLDEVARSDAVIHLAGEPIADGRWTARRKRRLVSSRIDSTRLIASALNVCETAAPVFICASAVGYYGLRGEEELREDSPPGDDFLAELCVDWEAAALAAMSDRVRVVCMRLGVVMSRRGGALAKMQLPFKIGLGGPIGPAERYFPWVHETDVIGLIEYALGREGGAGAHEPMRGPVNVVAPESVRMDEFAKALGRALGRPAMLPMPAFALRLALGELADALMPDQKVIPQRALDAGYRFQFGEIDAALRDCVGASGRPG